MKYEFHVGDYVEREVSDGTNLKTLVGYVNFYQPLLDSCGVIHCFGFTWRDGTRDGGACTECQLPMFFDRIGQYDFAKMRYQYDFTKPEQPKEIKKLPDGYGDGFVLYKGTTEVDGTVSNGWVSIGVLSNKINELVDAVNELRKASHAE